MLNVHRIISGTTVEGPGRRTAIWLQGCSRHCEGCFVPETWPTEPRSLYTPADLADRIHQQKDIEGVTILGGEPFDQAKELAGFLALLHKDLSVIAFSGYRLDELKRKKDADIDAILQHIDVLVDGEYRSDKRDLSRPMVGSSNQTFHFLTERYRMEDFPDRKIEVRLSKNGSVLINGNGEIARIKVG